jgi:hypothetical protein
MVSEKDFFRRAIEKSSSNVKKIDLSFNFRGVTPYGNQSKGAGKIFFQQHFLNLNLPNLSGLVENFHQRFHRFLSIEVHDAKFNGVKNAFSFFIPKRSF